VWRNLDLSTLNWPTNESMAKASIESHELLLLRAEVQWSPIKHNLQRASGGPIVMRSIGRKRFGERSCQKSRGRPLVSVSPYIMQESKYMHISYIYMEQDSQRRQYFPFRSGLCPPLDLYDGGPGLFAAATRRTLSRYSPEPPYRCRMPHCLEAQLPGLEGCPHVTSISGGISILDNGASSERWRYDNLDSSRQKPPSRPATYLVRM